MLFSVFEYLLRHFPGGPVVKTLPLNGGGTCSISGWTAKIPHDPGPKKNMKQKQYCNKFNKDLKKLLRRWISF